MSLFAEEGCALIIKPRSVLYKGIFNARILSRERKTWIISMPEVKGKFIPLPVGTVLEVSFPDGSRPSFQSEVIARSFGAGRYLTITAPYSISSGAKFGKTKKLSRVIAVSSGKGGVGKSTLTLNLALALQSRGKRCCIIDVDLGTANIDVLLNLKASYNLYHLIEGDKDIEEIVVRGPQGLLFVPGGSGLEGLANMGERQFGRLMSAFNVLEELADFLLLDTGTGVSRNVTNFLLAADEIVLIATPEPHAIMDVYSLIKVLANYDIQSGLKLIVNKAEKEEEAYHVWNAISSVSRQFLYLPVEYLGLIPLSSTVALSVKRQQPFFLSHPKHIAAVNMLKIAQLLTGVPAEKEKGGFLPFLYKLKKKFMAVQG